jgi:hypothetical protein
MPHPRTRGPSFRRSIDNVGQAWAAWVRQRTANESGHPPAERRLAANFFTGRCRESATGAVPGATAATMVAP